MRHSNRKSSSFPVQIPESFLRRYCPLVDDEKSFLESLLRPLPRAIRVNTLKSARESIQKKYADYGIELCPVPWYEDAFVAPAEDPSPTLEHFLGQVYVQELTSMLPPLVVAQETRRANLALDACAAPGSKTTQMAALMNNRGTLIANDNDYNRIRALQYNLSKAGAYNYTITNLDFGKFPEAKKFDVILLDAPCSSDGTVRKVPKLLAKWTPERTRRYSSLQKHLIKKAFDLLKPGGVLVYSTCSFSPGENEEVVAHLLDNRQATIEPFVIPSLKMAPGLTHYGDISYPRPLSACRRIWPQDNDTSGFFLARIRK